MKLTIKNIERINGLGDYNSAFMPHSAVTYNDMYELGMEYKGKAWKVVLHRDKPDGETRWDLVVFLGGIGWQATRMSAGELSSPGLTLSIIESLMDRIIKKYKI